MRDRVILHCDCNSFYASVELLSHPDLRDKPVAVAGDPENRHGIILAKNEPAKTFGVRTAETVWKALQKCPDLVLLPAHHDLSEYYSKKVNEIYLSYTDQVEPFGIDESWLDITGSLPYFKKTGPQLADEIRQRVKSELGLTISVGVSFNKVFAKLGSDYKKPDATTVFDRANYRPKVHPLPVSDLLFVGRSAVDALKKMGIVTIGQLAAADPEALRTRLGKWGDTIGSYARGEDDSPVRPYGQRDPIQSVGNGQTFRRNLVGEDDIKKAVIALSDRVSARLKKHMLKCRTLQLVIRDPSFKNISRQRPLPRPTNLQQDLYRAAMELLHDCWDFTRPIRMLTLTGA
ncbi:MAG: DNA polymerase IV, partial [Christensenellaceae bacterium]|nr:DNA polymerase IV [Christensenellaceae bacterium]